MIGYILIGIAAVGGIYTAYQAGKKREEERAGTETESQTLSINDVVSALKKLLSSETIVSTSTPKETGFEETNGVNETEGSPNT